MLMPDIFKENLFDDFFNDFARPSRALMGYSAPANHMMRTDIKETATDYELDIDLPGYDKKDVQAELKDGYLTVSAATRKLKGNRYHILHRRLILWKKQLITIKADR